MHSAYTLYLKRRRSDIRNPTEDLKAIKLMLEEVEPGYNMDFINKEEYTIRVP